MSIFSLHLSPYSPDAGFKQEGYYIWCGSVIREEGNGLYHLFASRWKAELPFHPGWLIGSEVVRAVSESVCGPYRFAEVVLPPRGAEYWDGRMTHNPRILKCGKKYVLFYTGSTHPFELPDGGISLTNQDAATIVARANKRIGIAVSDSLYGPWTRFERPVLDTKPGTFYSFLTSNPSPLVETDGSIYLIFKSRAYEGSVHGRMYLGAARAEAYDAPFRVITPEPFHFGEVEDPFVWHDDREYRMIAKDITGRIGGIPADGIGAYSSDGLVWKTTGPVYRRSGTDKFGIEHAFALMERPFLYRENGSCRAFFAAVSPEFPYLPGKRVQTWISAWDAQLQLI